MEVVAEGLVRWESEHPDWNPASDPQSPGYWPQSVGCVAVRGERATVFVDPLAPRGDDDWATLDALAEGRDRVIVTTIAWHVRDRERFAARYDATLLRFDDPWPADVVALPVPAASETMVWIPAHRVLVPGDLLLGDDDGGLRICPPSWLELDPAKSAGGATPPTVADVQATLRAVVPRPVAAVLTSHWPPVLAGADAALEHALA